MMITVTSGAQLRDAEVTRATHLPHTYLASCTIVLDFTCVKVFAKTIKLNIVIGHRLYL